MKATSSPSDDGTSTVERQAVLLCQVGSIVCALPLPHVAETMRPLPIEAVAGAAAFIDGVSIIRGTPLPVIDLARLLGHSTAEPRTRLLVVKIGERNAALSVGSVVGIRYLDPAELVELPPLLAGVSSEVVSAVGSLEARLLLVLETSKVLPHAGWATVEGPQA